ncbi:hypothetical protein ABPG75_010541 [Micractinium tetrahymenae]
MPCDDQHVCSDLHYSIINMLHIQPSKNCSITPRRPLTPPASPAALAAAVPVASARLPCGPAAVRLQWAWPQLLCLQPQAPGSVQGGSLATLALLHCPSPPCVPEPPKAASVALYWVGAPLSGMPPRRRGAAATGGPVADATIASLPDELLVRCWRTSLRQKGCSTPCWHASALHGCAAGPN